MKELSAERIGMSRKPGTRVARQGWEGNPRAQGKAEGLSSSEGGRLAVSV